MLRLGTNISIGTPRHGKYPVGRLNAKYENAHMKNDQMIKNHTTTLKGPGMIHHELIKSAVSYYDQ